MNIFHFQKKKAIWGAAIGMVIAVAVDILFMLGAFNGLESKSYDIRAKVVRKDIKPHSDIALILIDEASLRAMNPLVGRWPWPRSIYGDLLDFLVMGGARAIIFDILFTENEKTVFGSDELGPNDQILVEATAASGNVYHAAQIITDVEDELNKSLLDKQMPEDFVTNFSVKQIEKESFEKTGNNNFYLPFRELYQISKGVGVVEFAPDADGVYRKTRLFRHYQGNYYPIMPVSILLDELQPERITRENGNLVFGGIRIPIQEDGSYLINMYNDFNSYSIGGVLASAQKMQQGEVDNLMVSPEEFENKIVLIGASAVGVEDLKATPLQNRTPGVMLHASIISNVLQRDFLKKIPNVWTRITIYSITVLLALLFMILASIYLQVFLPLVTVTAYVILAFAAFEKNVVVDMVPPLVSVFGVWISSFTYLYFTEGRDRRKVRRMLGQYVSPAVLTEVVDSGGHYLKAEVGSTENLTILFSDIRGFTTISEHMEAEKVVAMLNRYLSEMVDIIFDNNGTLDKFIGDAIMAFWGAPIKVKDHGKRAVHAAVEMIRKLEVLNEELAGTGFPSLKMGIGLHTGNVVLGNIGSEKKLDYTIIGDNVNLASRLENLTKFYDCDLLVSEATFNELGGEYPCRIADHVRVKGKKEPIKIYSVPGIADDPEEEQDLNRKICRYTEAAFNKYLGREFEESCRMYTELLNFLKKDRISEIFIARCQQYIKAPPPEEWDGVFKMKTK